MEIDFQRVLIEFNKDLPDWYGWINPEDGEVLSNVKVVKDGATIPTQAEFDSKKDELEIIQNRIFAYPSIGDQLDMLFHAIDGDETLKTQFADFHTALKAVKDNNPKG
tara:strand:+ start:515 stop:838 length:324 start_codon:yes stop_codon:yes gene_type:complete